MMQKLIDCTARVQDAISKFKCPDIEKFWAFDQVHGNTSFNRAGGNTIVTAIVHVVETSDGKFHVFFNGGWAYSVSKPTEKFFKDLFGFNMKPTHEAMINYNAR